MRRLLAAIALGAAIGAFTGFVLASSPGRQAPACHHQVAGAVPSPATAVQRAIASAPPICG